MLLSEVPDPIPIVKLCKTAPAAGLVWQGRLPLGKITGLSEEILSKETTEVAVSLRFFVDQAGYCCVEGKLEADLGFICQRCLAPMSYPLEARFLVSPITKESQIDNLPEEYEPLWAPSQEIKLMEWIAEELNLALPLVPRHEDECVSFIANTD